MLPMFKETVEELFQEGLVKVVFATETLSLGINMPAKSVVIEDLWKFQGERHELVTPGEYTQLTGRAGRRGIDALGHAVVIYQKQVPFERVAGLAATRTYDLASSFRPSYNMAVNLVRNYTPEQAHHLLNSSFAQFLADRGVVALERSRQQDLATLEGYRTNMVCHLGDFEEYWGYLEKARQLREEDRRTRDQGRRDEVRESVARLRPGDVVWVPRARRRGVAVVVSSRDGKPTVLAQDRQFFRLNDRDFEEPPQVLTRIPLPKSGSVRNPRFRRDVAARLVALDVKAGGGRRRGGPIPRSSGKPPVSRSSPRHIHAVGARSGRSTNDGRCERGSSSDGSAAWSDGSGFAPRPSPGSSIGSSRCSRALGYVDAWSLTTKGRTLTRIYGEGDLLVGEALGSGLLDDLRPSEVVALLSAVIYEGRERVPLSGEMPTAETKERYERLQRLWRKVRRTEDEHQVQLCRELEAGFATPIYHWAEGDAAGRHPRRDRDGARRLHPELQAARGSAAADRGGRGSPRWPRRSARDAERSCAASSPTRGCSYDAEHGQPVRHHRGDRRPTGGGPRTSFRCSSARSTSAGSSTGPSWRTGRIRRRSRPARWTRDSASSSPWGTTRRSRTW